MPHRQLPPLTAIRAFEAAARHLSFRDAAKELNVTHSAISHQIRTLEAWLECRLFEKDGRNIKLNSQGQRYFPIIQSALDDISTATAQLKDLNQSNTLTVHVYVTMAVRWLLPRMHDFHSQYPDIKVRLSTTYLSWEFDSDHADIGIIYTRQKQPELIYQKLFPAPLIPVCSPKLLSGDNPIHTPRDLQHHQLLNVYTAPDHWSIWLNAAGVDPKMIPGDQLMFDNYLLALEAALDGRGVAMTNGPYANEDLRNQRLVRPFDLEVDSGGYWYLVFHQQDKNRTDIQAFTRWIKDISRI